MQNSPQLTRLETSHRAPGLEGTWVVLMRQLHENDYWME